MDNDYVVHANGTAYVSYRMADWIKKYISNMTYIA